MTDIIIWFKDNTMATYPWQDIETFYYECDRLFCVETNEGVYKYNIDMISRIIIGKGDGE